MKKRMIIMGVLVILTSSSLYAKVIINTGNMDWPNEWKLGLNALGNYDTDDLDANRVSGEFTGGVANDTFTVTVRAYNNFVQADALTAIENGTFQTYMTNLNPGTIDRVVVGGFGVDGKGISNENEVLTFTFGNYSLNPTTEVNFLGFNVGLYTAKNRTDLFFWDSSENTVRLLNVVGGVAGMTIIGEFDVMDIQSGDMVVIAGNASGENFRIDSVEFDLVTELATLGLVW